MLALCMEHARRFDLDVNPWTFLADVREAVSPAIERPQVPRGNFVDSDAARIRALKEKAAARFGSRVVEEERDYDLIGTRGDEWRFTRHAQERATKREFTPEQVLRAAAHPEIKLPNRNPTHPGTVYHVAGGCCAIVHPQQKRIITVLDYLEYSCRTVNDARKADQLSHARS